MKKICLTLLAIVCAGILFTGCSKDNNVTEVNNAYSIFAKASPSDWQLSSDGLSMEYVIDASNVPNGFVFNTDGVLIYMSGTNDDNSSYYPLPTTTFNFDGFDFNYHLENNTIVIDATLSNGNPLTNSTKPSTDLYFNVIFVQPKDISAANSIKDDYNAVKAAFHLSK